MLPCYQPQSLYSTVLSAARAEHEKASVCLFIVILEIQAVFILLTTVQLIVLMIMLQILSNGGNILVCCWEGIRKLKGHINFSSCCRHSCW